jgi:hypothetical protein
MHVFFMELMRSLGFYEEYAHVHGMYASAYDSRLIHIHAGSKDTVLFPKCMHRVCLKI